MEIAKLLIFITLESNAWNGIKSFYKELGVALSQHREDDHQVADHYAARAKPRYV